jgi:hypothetical protein
MIRWDFLVLWLEAHETLLGWLGIFSLMMFIGTLIAIPMIIVVLPEDVLSREDEIVSRLLLNVWYFPYWVLKNAFGVVFILAGVAMLVLPGQGLLTILIGLILVTFPGKKKLIRRILGRRRVLKAMNALRRRFNKRPIHL